MFHSKSHLTNNKDNQINSVSKASANSTLHNIIKDKNRSHLQKSFSLSSILFSEKLQAEYEHNNLQNQINVFPTEVSIQFLIVDNGHWLHQNQYYLLNG